MISWSRAGYVVATTLLVALASCGGQLPSSAIGEGQSERAYGQLTSSTALTSLMRDRGLKAPDTTAALPLLRQLQAELAKSDPEGSFDGVTYELTDGNVLGRDWLIQTPNRWGRKADDLPFFPLDCKDCEKDVALPSCSTDSDCGGGVCGSIWPRPGERGTGSSRAPRRKVCLGHSDALIERIHGLISGARRNVDITLLQPAPDTRLLAALRAGINDLVASRRPVSIRVMVGQYPPDGTNAAALLKELTSEATDILASRISIGVAAMRSCTVLEDCDSFSWNHAKIISVDGREALVGGHNMWSTDYLLDNPVHDLSMQVRGPAATSASRFADRLWRYVCDNVERKESVTLVTLGGSPCPPPASPARGAASSDRGIPILAVGRLGFGITKDFANHSELARDLLFGAARDSIRIVQQDIGFRVGRSDTLFPESTFERLIDFLETRQGDIYIVLSNPGGVGNGGNTYFTDVPLEMVARRLREIVQSRVEARDPKSRYAIRRGPDPVNQLLCDRIHLASFRFGPDAAWPSGRPIANHSKFWMIDDRAFYIGSDNMYPVNLQEFGYIVDDRKAATELLDSYWTPLWQWSRAAAVSGRGVEKCIFRQPLK